MKALAVPFFALAALVVAGCGPSNPAVAAPAAAPAAVPGPRTIVILASDNMKYSVTQIDAHPGEALKIVLTNVGTVPKEAMAHNWVLLQAGSNAAFYATKAVQAKDTGYLPPALQAKVIASIDLVGPRESHEVEFTAPTVPGQYPYLCTFPAHYQMGMAGILTVK